MATKISITTGPLTVERVFENDAVAQATFLLFYKAFALGLDNATPKQKLEAILNWITLFIREKAVQYHMEQSRAASVAEGKQLYDLGGIEEEGL